MVASLKTQIGPPPPKKGSITIGQLWPPTLITMLLLGQLWFATHITMLLL